MASLKEIMNFDEENLDTDANKRDKASVPRFSDADTISSASRYASSTEPPFTSSSDPSGRTSASSHRPPHSLAPGTATSSPASSAPEDRRRSNTSTDSMDHPYYGYPQGHQGTGGQPPRSYASSGSGGETPIKLTPITGRVSRAKKGVPVHICELCRPPKTFTRAEHLRRHQLSHQPPDLQCSVPGCDKVFHRRDLLERHQLRHEQETKAHGDGQRSNMVGSGNAAPYMGLSDSNTNYQMQPSGFGVDSDMTMDQTSWSNLGDHHHMPSSYAPNGYRLQTDFSAVQPSPYLPPGSNSQWPDSRGLSSVNSVSPNSIGAYSSSSSNRPSEWDEHTGAFSIAPSASAHYAYGTSPPAGHAFSGYDGHMSMSMGGYPEDAAMHSPDALMNSSAVRSLPPSLVVGQSSETLVTLPASTPSHRITSRQVDCDPQTEDLFGLTTSFANASLSLDHESRSAVPSYLNVYWDRVYPLHPIVHPSIFEKFSDAAPEHLEILQCALAAVATQFLEDHLHRINGHRLYQHAWNSVKLHTAQTSAEWPLPIMLAILNCEYYALYRGRKKESHRPSARFAKLYQIAIDQQNTISPTSPSQRGLSAWKLWIDAETGRRILAACFLLDVHSMIYYEQPPIVIKNLNYSCPSSLPIPLTAATTALWEAADHERWGELLGQGQLPLETVGSLMSKSLSADDVAAMPLLDAGLLQTACALRLPRRRDPTKVDLLEDPMLTVPREMLPELFPTCPVSNVYMALHYTPLHILLSVSGESWVFNKKISRPGLFSEHKVELADWRCSTPASVAVAFAARALRYFFDLTEESLAGGGPIIEHVRSVRWRSLSDFWGVYVCALILWSFGYGEKRKEYGDRDASRQRAVKWLMTVSEMYPGDVVPWSECRNTLAVVCLARDVLARDCVGGRNILFADSVNVLRKLAGRTSGSESESD